MPKALLTPEPKVVYLLQGGGALGAYQVGVCESLLQSCAPDWVIGTSIGAINAAIIVGNEPHLRVQKLKEFWETIALPAPLAFFQSQNTFVRKWQHFWFAQWALCFGDPGFFSPRLNNFWLQTNISPDKASFYDTTALAKTLEKLIDFDLINQKKIRLTLGAVCVDEGELEHFDNTFQEIDLRHVMASSALPPGFPAVHINGKNYWDGGISSNTPLELVFSQKFPKQLLCFMVDLFANREHTPKSIVDVLTRRKDLEFASRYRKVVSDFCEQHRLRHIISQLCETNAELINFPGIKELDLKQPCSLNLVRFLYLGRPDELWSKDFEFSFQSIREHYQAGLHDAQHALKNPYWLHSPPDETGIALHEF